MDCPGLVCPSLAGLEIQAMAGSTCSSAFEPPYSLQLTSSTPQSYLSHRYLLFRRVFYSPRHICPLKPFSVCILILMFRTIPAPLHRRRHIEMLSRRREPNKGKRRNAGELGGLLEGYWKQEHWIKALVGYHHLDTRKYEVRLIQCSDRERGKTRYKSGRERK